MPASKVVSNIGGSAWESNPPETLLMPPDEFEVREAHRDLSAPDIKTPAITRTDLLYDEKPDLSIICVRPGNR